MKGKIFLLVFLLLLLAAAYYLSFGYFSRGERAGTISKLSERGYVFKTYEGMLNEGGFSGETGTLTPRYWNFSASNDTVVVKLRDALATGERITLEYQEKFFQFPWNGDTKYFITDVIYMRNSNNYQNPINNSTVPANAAEPNDLQPQLEQQQVPANLETQQNAPANQQVAPAQQQNVPTQQQAVPQQTAPVQQKVEQLKKEVL